MDDHRRRHAAEAAEEFLTYFNAYGDTPEDHRAETPMRMVKMFEQMCEPEEFNFTTFPATSQDMITLGPIPFYSLCAHHTAPFFGNAWVGYVPDNKLAGLSKFARAVRARAKGFHVQEELTRDIAAFLDGALSPL